MRTQPLLFVIRSLAIVVIAVTEVSGQTVLSDKKKIAEAENLFDSPTGDESSCEVLPIWPHFIFSLRLQAGYLARLPLAQSQVWGQKCVALARITPIKGNGNPVYLSRVVQLRSEGNSDHEAEVTGSYWLGTGRYSVKFLMFDDRGDACRKEWQIDARLSSDVRNFKPVLAPGTVKGVLSNGGGRAAGAKPVGRLTILLHAASVLQLQTLLRPSDKAMLLDGMVALMDEMPARWVRLVVFNLEQQKEILRRDGFTFDALPEVAQALNAVQPATVDYRALQHPGSTADFIQNLIKQEVHAPEPSDTVVFLGPRSIYKVKPSSSFALPPDAKQQFFYLVCEPTGILRTSSRSASGWGAQGLTMGFPPIVHGETTPQPNPTVPPILPDDVQWTNYGPNHGPDSIEYAVDQLRGKTVQVDSVESFADAVNRIVRLSRANR